jgi:hypothetical protein
LVSAASGQVKCFNSTTINYTSQSPVFNDTGASILVAITSSYTGYAMVTESQGPKNTWQVLGIYGDAASVRTVFTVSVAVNPNTSATHRFSHIKGASISLSGSVILACTGTSPNDVLEAITPNLSHSGEGNTTCQSPLSLVPQRAGDLLITAAGRSGVGLPATGWKATNDGIGFSNPILANAGVNQGGVAVAWKAAASTATFNPKWSTSSSNKADQWVCVNVVLRAATTPATRSVNPIARIVAGNGYEGHSGDGGDPVHATMNWPSEMVWWHTSGVPDGKILIIVDNQNNVIRAVNFDSSSHKVLGVTVGAGTINTVAGTGTQTCTGNGGAAILATMSHPVAIDQDSSGNVYIADQQCATIDKIDLLGRFSYVAGGGPGGVGSSGCGGPSHPYHGKVNNVRATSALLNCPQGIAVDANGNLVIADSNNYEIVAVNTQATTQTLYGVSIAAGYLTVIVGHGQNACAISRTPQPALRVSIKITTGLGRDSSGNIYGGSDCGYIYKLDTSGHLAAIVGTGIMGWSTAGTPALSAKVSLAFRAGVCTIGGSSTPCWTDTLNNEFRYLDDNGSVQTLMGNYGRWGKKQGYLGGARYGDNLSASLTALNYPIGYAQNPVDGSICISSLMSDVIYCTSPPTTQRSRSTKLGLEMDPLSLRRIHQLWSNLLTLLRTWNGGNTYGRLNALIRL